MRCVRSRTDSSSVIRLDSDRISAMRRSRPSVTLAVSVGTRARSSWIPASARRRISSTSRSRLIEVWLGQADLVDDPQQQDEPEDESEDPEGLGNDEEEEHLTELLRLLGDDP